MALQWEFFCQRLAKANLIARQAVSLSGYTGIITSTSAAETGWETYWIKKARAEGINTISLLDHWTNYLSRFLWQGDYIFPDAIWVCDAYALKLAQACQQQMPNYPSAQQIANFYLVDLVDYIQARKPTAALNGDDKNIGNILYVSEPSNNPLYTAQDALAGYLDYVLTQPMAQPRVRLRIHPREQVADYAAIFNQWQGLIALEWSHNIRLEDDLVWASSVVGCQTMAMVVALAAGIEVASCLPASVLESALPHQEIPRLFKSAAF